jgi:phosphatidylinositol-4-phosphate 3-kinase
MQTVEKRKAELNVYLKELIAMEPQVSESDVIYTFLHCLTRDEEDIKLNEGIGTILIN